MNFVSLVAWSTRVNRLDTRNNGKSITRNGTSGAAKDGDPWSLGTGDKIGDSARMKTSQNPREANDKGPYSN